MKKIKVGLIEPNALVREGYKLVIESNPKFEVCFEAASVTDTLEKLPKHTPDVLITDYTIDGINGIELCKELRAKDMEIPVVILTTYTNHMYYIHAFLAGTSAYLLKDCKKEVFFQAINYALKGKKYFGEKIKGNVKEEMFFLDKNVKEKFASFTKREKEIFFAIIDGYSSKNIALKMNVSVRTIDKHRLNMMEKVGVHTIVEVLNFFSELTI